MASDTEFVRATQEQREALAEPDRYRILRLLWNAPNGLSVDEIREQVGDDTNRLNFHLRVLEEAGMIVAEGPVLRFIADDRRYAWDFRDADLMSAYFSAQLAVEKDETEKAIYERARSIERGEGVRVVHHGSPSVVRTTHDEIEAFSERLLALCAEFRERRDKLQANREELRDLNFYYIVREEPASAEN